MMGFTSKCLVSSLALISSFTLAADCDEHMKKTAPDSRYEIVSDSNGREVLDKWTKLVWQRCALGQEWSAEKNSCEGDAKNAEWANSMLAATKLGNGYRMPNIKELQSLIEESCTGLAINENFFPNAGGRYWSSTALANQYNDTDRAWIVSFDDGDSTAYQSQGIAPYVRAVRSIQ